MTVAEILKGISSPLPTILRELENLNRQINFDTAAPTAVGESDKIEAEIYTGITASKRAAKPFIIGFIPPDTPVNFVPIRPALDEIGIKAHIQSKQSDSGGPCSKSITGKILLETGSDGRVKREWKRFSRSELRDAMYESYKKQTGEEPTEAWLRMSCAQIWSETGSWGNGDSMGAPNYNLGSTHATERGYDYMYKRDVNGRYVSEIRKGQRYVVTTASPNDDAVPQPSGGTWYISDDTRPVTDNEGKTAKQRYRQSFWAFPDLQSGVDYQVSKLLVQWPGTSCATTEEEYVDALTAEKGNHYFQASKKEYANGLKRQGQVYNAKFPEPKGVDGATTQTASEEAAEGKARNPRRLMTYGRVNKGVNDFNENDELSGRWGRTVDRDPRRDAIAKKQTDALKAQIENIKNTPPLILLVNPTEFTRSFEHTVDSGIKTRHGHVVHMWLEKPGKISSSGVTAGQYIVAASGAGGITTQNRVHSLSYANLSSLVGMYKNNGRIFIGDEANPANRGVQLLAFTVYIYYDEHIYLGSFDDFQVTDDANKPFNMSYSLKFNVRYDMPMSAKPNSAYRETDYRISRGVDYLEETSDI